MGLAAAARVMCALMPQPRLGLERYGPSIISVIAVMLAVAVIMLMLVNAWIRVTTSRPGRPGRSEGWDIHILDRLHHVQFEEAVRDLMRCDGARDAVRVGGAGDNGADVKGTDPVGRRWVIQCTQRRDGAQSAPRISTSATAPVDPSMAAT